MNDVLQRPGRANFPATIANLYERAEPERRARLLNVMIPAVGPLALSVLGSGIFAKYMFRTRWQEVSVSLDDAARVTGDQLLVLARYVEQSDSSVIERVCSMLAEQTTTVPALTVAVMALAMHMIARRRQAPSDAVADAGAGTRARLDTLKAIMAADRGALQSECRRQGLPHESRTDDELRKLLVTYLNQSAVG